MNTLLFKRLFWLSAILIAYGSLYPFNFHWHSISLWQLSALNHSWFAHTGKGDILANVILFTPFGLSAYFAFPNIPSKSRLTMAIISGFLLATSVQVIQFWLPSRMPGMQDATWNMLGLVIGWYLAVALRPIIAKLNLNTSSRSSLAGLIIFAWLAYSLAPFVPTLSLSDLKNSLKPLLLQPHFDPIATLRHISAWFVIAALLHELKSPKTILLGLIVAVWLGKILIVSASLSVANVIGPMLAIALWQTPGLQRWSVALALLISSLLISGLAPFNLHYSQPFHWLPFDGALTGSMIFNLQVLLEKAFFFSSLAYVLMRWTHSRRLTIILSSAFIGAIEISQIVIGHHTAEITDVLIMLGISVLLSEHLKQT